MRGVAPAKVNLYLEVVGRRPDGYHDLKTLFQTVAWGDDVEVEDADTMSCTVGGEVGIPTDETNLALRAAHAWREATGHERGVRVHLGKRVPAGGGLGGGSSDAACVLRLLQALHPARALPPDRLREVARGLGADVPFLLDGGTAIGVGRGDDVRPLPPAPPVTLVLLLAPFPTSTVEVYARVAERIRRAPKDGLDRAVEAVASGVPERIREAHHNDLGEAAMRAVPALRALAIQAERLLGRPPCLTGSGSTLFDVPDEGEAEDVVARWRSLPGRREVVRTDGR